VRVGELAEALGARVVGDARAAIRRNVHPGDACEFGDLAIAISAEALRALKDSRARMALVVEGAETPPSVETLIVTPRSRTAFAAATNVLRVRPVVAPGVHPSAIVAASARIDAAASVGPLAVIGEGVTIGPGAVIESQATLAEGAVVGRDCHIHSGARIGRHCRLGERVIVHYNAAIGADGFGFIPERPSTLEGADPGDGRNRLHKTHSLSIVEIGDDVEIGANSCIDRGTIRPTRIGSGTKIDDLVMIGHNADIGADCMLCGQVGLAGSVTVGDGAILGGRTGFADHVRVGARAIIAGGSAVGGNVPAGEVYIGVPAAPRKQFMADLRIMGRLRRQHSTSDRPTASDASTENSKGRD